MACPICEKETVVAYRPFCSKRCADVDLAKWLGGSYAVPSQNEDDFDELTRELEKAAQEDEDEGKPPRLS